jgi:hypothetical protein
MSLMPAGVAGVVAGVDVRGVFERAVVGLIERGHNGVLLSSEKDRDPFRGRGKVAEKAAVSLSGGGPTMMAEVSGQLNVVQNQT